MSASGVCFSQVYRPLAFAGLPARLEGSGGVAIIMRARRPGCVRPGRTSSERVEPT
jgi:hypothetical protein